MEAPSERDARPTPRWLRVPVVLLCALLMGYFATAYTYALEKEAPDWLRRNPWSLWLGTWQMFTYIDRSSTIVEAEAQVDGEWVDIDLESLFPFRWESGPRYARSSFRRSGSRMAALGSATCSRLRTQDGIEAERVRFRSIRWKKQKGLSPQPRDKAKVQPILDWDCDRTARRPSGRVW